MTINSTKYLNYSSKFDECDFNFEDTEMEFFDNEAKTDEKSIQRWCVGKFFFSTEEEFTEEEFKLSFWAFQKDKTLVNSKKWEKWEFITAYLREDNYSILWENISL